MNETIADVLLAYDRHDSVGQVDDFNASGGVNDEGFGVDAKLA
jgi:hypothetical protein